MRRADRGNLRHLCGALRKGHGIGGAGFDMSFALGVLSKHGC
jgi:hypothetical protein